MIGCGVTAHFGHSGGDVIRLDAVEIVLSEGLPGLEVTDATGTRVGALLGHPVDLFRGSVPRGKLCLEAALGSDVDAFVEEQIHRRLGGSFIFVLDHGGCRRVYLDAGGSMSAVYDPEARRVAATTPLLLAADEYLRRFDGELHGYLKVSRDGWFPAGLTAHKGIHRVQCNHYLDLADWQQQRHWPRAQIAVTDDPEAASRTVAEASRRVIDGLRAAGTVTIALTGGNESRLLLAVCRDIVENLDFVTIANREQHLDLTLVEQLVERARLPHRFIPGLVATPEASEAYLMRSGHCIGDGRARGFPSVAPLARVDYFVNGVGGGVGRGFFWRRGDTAETPLDPRGLTTRLGMPVHPKVVAAVARWLDGVAGLDTFLTLDLAFLELRMAPWAFANAYGTPEVRHIHPLVSRTVFETMVGLPYDWRRQGLLTTSIVRQYWPELLDVRINSYGDYRDWVRLIKRVAANPSQIARKFRRKLA